MSTIQAVNPWLVGVFLNLGLGLLTWPILKKLLTPAGLLHAWALGVIVWGTLGWAGYAVIVFYFLAGSGVTKIGSAEKEAAGIAEKRSGARGPENVWGSALVGALCALSTLVVPESLHPLLVLGYVASLSTKLSDTSASEIGKAYGRHTFLITTLKPVPRGTEGAISAEGTVAGVVGSVAIALLAWAVGLISPLGIGFCILAAFIATNFESLIGATLQHRFDWLTNELVNVINTLIGAIAAIGMGWVWTLF
ncbi:MAG: TIGR00297 family protein [Thermosynechococcaceae cyanobacterium MS004]|nr:TIGR00297 family protein [Thermosynechococcaceae cyanobacterium MS004]